MQQITSYQGSVYGGLGDLLLRYCQANQLPAPTQLLHVQNLPRFDYQVWYQLLNELDQQHNQPALGLDIAQYVELKHLGVLGYLAQSCEHLGEALLRYHDFYRLIYDGSPLIFNKNQDHLIIGWDVPKVFTTQVTNEIAIAIMYQFLRHFLHIDDVALIQVDFMHPAPKDTMIYQRYFGCPVLFSQPTAQIVLPSQILSKPIRHADQTLQHLLMAQAQTLLEKLPHTTQLDERLQQAILKQLQKQQLNIEVIATQLHTSVRQLQRHLQSQNTTFQARVQAIRQMLAFKYLQDPHLSLQEIALLLGYSEQSAFQRAFKLWTQQTPQQWRKHNVM
ncbi:transcriptional regulator, AraC family [Acinetobacter marinus]|uniref:Transcriptional regulator, AraC family n=1 Tax=Acinetobacter marinus TaxID=281375 RepID=A0A1G6NVV9_9GAMM|nr:AraC family transcriptional regulator [Acinetobacter marinus]SDC72072.1 transcriptional regulator, AraC family [Acinetobacter marinus]